MSVAGIIAEYDPFHNGHLLHLRETKAFSPDGVVVVLGGNFTQRGAPAAFPKRVRAKMALAAGADLVLELPLPFSMARAETFASGGVELLASLGVVDTLSFGSECGDLSLLQRAAEAVDSETTQAGIRRLLQSGTSYAAAREAAVCERYGEAVAAVLRTPNDILGVEYLRACRRLAPALESRAVLRRGAAHNAAQPSGRIASASRLREALFAGEPVRDFVPAKTVSVLEDAVRAGLAPASFAGLEAGVLAFLRTAPDALAHVPDFSEGLANRIAKAARTARTLEELYDTAKTKRYAHARIRRAVWSAYLGVRESDAQGGVPYIRVLGFSERGASLLQTAAGRAAKPMVLRASDIRRLDARAERIFSLECAAADVHALLRPQRGVCGEEMTEPLIRV